VTVGAKVAVVNDAVLGVTVTGLLSLHAPISRSNVPLKLAVNVWLPWLAPRVPVSTPTSRSPAFVAIGEPTLTVNALVPVPLCALDVPSVCWSTPEELTRRMENVYVMSAPVASMSQECV
jgi:hypothetical protein